MGDKREDLAESLWEWALSGPQAAALFGSVVTICIAARLFGFP